MPESRSPAVEPVVPLADGEYLRSFDAQIDVLDAARIFVRGRMRDPQAMSADALLSWQKDRAYMGALADSCYTYRDASAEVFKSRLIVSIVGPEITQPAPGSAFWRRKHLSLRAVGADGRAFLCESAMEDPLHHIAVGFRLGADGTIRAAHSRALRLPYSGLCEEPQLRSARLNGLRLSRAFIGEIAERIGGTQGCTHLFDLTVDCLRLFRL